MQINLWSNAVFTKKTNSTKVPPQDATPLSVTGEIKGDFSPLNPTFRFSETVFPVAQLPGYNYAYVPQFSRYYFVSWAFISGAWEASCKCDVLASYRTPILNSSQYVARSASRLNYKIVDGNYTTTGDATNDIQGKDIADIFGISNDLGGVYVVGVVGYTYSEYDDSQQIHHVTPTNVGAITYYAMARAAFTLLMFSLLHDINWMDIDPSEISENLQKALINPMQYIVSVIWLPVNAWDFIFNGGQPFPDPELEASKTHVVRCGWWDIDLGSGQASIIRKLSRPLSEYNYRAPSYTFNLVAHPQAAQRGVWLNLSPYTRRVIELPCFGNFELDTTKMQNASQLTVQYFINTLVGDAFAYVWAGIPSQPRQQLVLSVSGQVGVPIPIGQVALDIGNYKNGLIAGAAAGVQELVNVVTDGGDKK